MENRNIDTKTTHYSENITFNVSFYHRLTDLIWWSRFGVATCAFLTLTEMVETMAKSLVIQTAFGRLDKNHTTLQELLTRVSYAIQHGIRKGDFSASHIL